MRIPNRTSRRQRSRVIALSLPLVAILGGCAGLDRRSEPVEAEQARLVARDFVSALTQLRGFTPKNTTLQVRPPETPFGDELASELRRAGFGMQMVPQDDTGPLLVSYDMESFDEGDAGQSVGYRLRVGAVELGREYEVRSGRVFPMTALSVRGTRISESPLDDSIFDRNVASEAAAVEPLSEAPGEQSGDGAAAERSILLPPLDDNRAETSWQKVQASSGQFADESLPMNLEDNDVAQRVGNKPDRRPIEWGPQDVFALGGEAFSKIKNGYVIDAQQVLMFSDDSIRLWDSNRPQLAELASGFDPATEVVTVLGLSHGPTGAPGRNRALAIGRADRVRVGLLALGVDPSKILEEGSWSAKKSPGPDRGVIVSVHKRVEPKNVAARGARKDS